MIDVPVESLKEAFEDDEDMVALIDKKLVGVKAAPHVVRCGPMKLLGFVGVDDIDVNDFTKARRFAMDAVVSTSDCVFSEDGTMRSITRLTSNKKNMAKYIVTTYLRFLHAANNGNMAALV